MVLYFKLLVCLYVCTLWICIWMYGLPHSLFPCATIVESLKQSAVRGVGVRGGWRLYTASLPGWSMGIDVPQSNVSRLKQFYGGHFLCPSGLWHRQATPSLVHLLCSLPSSSCHLNSLFVGMLLWGPQCDWAMLLHLNNQLLDGEICKECKETQNVWLSTGNTPKYEWNFDG